MERSEPIELPDPIAERILTLQRAIDLASETQRYARDLKVKGAPAEIIEPAVAAAATVLQLVRAAARDLEAVLGEGPAPGGYSLN